jgi:RNA polymerase sigma factor (sigma-70 family)
MYSAVKKRVLNHRRHARVVRLAATRADAGAAPGASEPPRLPDAAVDANQLRSALDQVLRELPDDRRRIVMLRWKHQLSYPEIAQLLEISVAAAQAQVSRVQRAVRPLLRHFREEG